MFKRNKNLYPCFFLLFFITAFFINTNRILAATINISPVSGTYHVGDTIKMKVNVSSGTPINAVSADVSFSNDILSLSSLSKVSSIISLWAQEPTFSNSSGSANFEGVILNGYIGNSGNIITLVFKAKKEGQTELKFSKASILANDGNGTELISGKQSSLITIVKAIEKVEEVKPSPIENIVEKTKEVVEEVRKVEQVNNIPDYSLVIILMLIIILLLILIIIYGIYFINKFKNYIKKKLKKTEENISKEFETLEKDIYKEAIISKKIKENEKLNEEEKTALVDFKQDIKDTEKAILEDIKDIENNN